MGRDTINNDDSNNKHGKDRHWIDSRKFYSYRGNNRNNVNNHETVGNDLDSNKPVLVAYKQEQQQGSRIRRHTNRHDATQKWWAKMK